MALVGAGVFGLSSASSGLSVDGTTVSARAFRAELTAIATTPALQCYVTALSPANYAPGAGAATMSASGAAAWTNLRVEGLAILQFVHSQFHYAARSQDLAVAESSLEGEMTQAAAASRLSCPSTSAQALAAMTPEMRDAEVQAQAASLFLVSKLNSTIPLTGTSLRTYYASHSSNYDTLCVSVALVPPSQVRAFASEQTRGATVAQLAKKFSVDPSSKHGGAYGCFGPESSTYAAVRADAGRAPLGRFPAAPQTVSLNGAPYALYVAVDQRVATPFARALGAVLADVRTINANSANTVKQNLLYRAAVAVDPAFGRWGLASTGPMVFAPATPAASDVAATTTLSTPSTTPYK